MTSKIPGGHQMFDALVIGSGAGGAVVAHELTKAGMSVCMVEKGPYYQLRDFVHDEVDICRRTFFVPSPADEPNMVALDSAPAEHSANGWISCCVGGGTVHMGGYFFRMTPDDFRLKSAFGAVAGSSLIDWPIGHAELAPYYDEIEALIGVSGPASEALPPSQRRSLMPPMAQHQAASMLDDAAKASGVNLFQTPRAISTIAKDGRGACVYCGYCASYGCEVGAKSSTLASLVPDALATGKLTLLADTMVRAITMGPSGLASGVLACPANGGPNFRLLARRVIVAAGAIQTARLMLASKLPLTSDQLGRNLLFATQAQASAEYELPHAAFAAGREFPFIDRATTDFYDVKKSIRHDGGALYSRAGTLLFMLPHVNPIFQAEQAIVRHDAIRLGGQQAASENETPLLWGQDLTQQLHRHFVQTKRLEMESFAEFFPNAGTRITLDPTVVDKFGLPVARVEVELHEATKRASKFLLARGRELLEATAPASVATLREHDVYWPLQAGTARMASSAKDGVTNRDGRVFGIANLYVTDGAALPTGGGAPFTLTIMANALRIARGLAKSN